MSAIIVLTIGPVQSYISQARRTQDLWQGSRILSYLAGAGVDYAMQREAEGLAKVIYPIKRPDQVDNIPNRIVVQWFGEIEDASKCARKMEEEIRIRFQRISVNTLNYFIQGVDASEQETVMEIWQRQESNWLECYWVVSPYVDVDENSKELPKELEYAYNMDLASAALGARKLIRNFPQINEGGRKCSITGEHEALHGNGNYVEFWENQKADKADRRNLALLSKHERLSAISTIKRFAHEEENKDGKWIPINEHLEIDKRFPSTSSIAAVPFKYDVLAAIHDVNINTRTLKEALQQFIAALLECFDEDRSIPVKGERDPVRNLFFTKHGDFNPEHFPKINSIDGIIFDTGEAKRDSDLYITQFMCIDGDYLFEDTLVIKTIAEYMPLINAEGDKLRELENKRNRLLKPKVKKALQALQNLIHAAADLEIMKPQPYLVILSMDGDNMGKVLSHLGSPNQHQEFSATLANFAKENVSRIVEEEHLGRVVYAGGDDVMALLPVCHALGVAEAIRTEFQDTIASIGTTNHEGKAVTASTGLAYVHHTHNLQDAVQAANSAQKIAKNDYGRNAIAIKFLRRSGEPRRMGQKWQPYTDVSPTITNVKQLIEAFQANLSRNLPQDVAQITYSMANVSVPEDARLGELGRIIKRRLPESKKDHAPEIVENILALIAAPSDELEAGWENAQAWLELARFIAQIGGEQA